MQLVSTENEARYNIYFSEQETKNIKAILDDNISCSNKKLCYFIEKIVPEKFEEFKDGRLMIMDVYNRL